MSFSTVWTPTVLPSAMAIFSACSVVAAVPDTFTLSPSIAGAKIFGGSETKPAPAEQLHKGLEKHGLDASNVKITRSRGRS